MSKIEIKIMNLPCPSPIPPQRTYFPLTNMEALQLSFDLFPPLTFEELLSQQNVSTLRVVMSPRLRRGWNVRQSTDGHRILTIPAYFGQAPIEVKSALISWALLPFRGPKSRLQRKALERGVWEYTKTDPSLPRPHRTPPQWNPSKAIGCCYDLRELFDSLNQRHFEGRLLSQVRWGKAGTRTSYQMFRTGNDGSRHSYITIAGVYNRPDVPQFAVEGVLFHEMAHEALPPETINGRRSIHGKKFRELEQSYPHYREWIEWERRYLRR